MRYIVIFAAIYFLTVTAAIVHERSLIYLVYVLCVSMVFLLSLTAIYVILLSVGIT